MKFLIATHNMKKRDELSRILQPLGVEAVLDSDLGVTLEDVEETGETFKENARLKALAGCKETGLACIADDSGLCVDALSGRPGVYSARYAGGHDTPYSHKMAVLLSELEGLPREKRTARFVSSVCCVFPDSRELCVEGVCEGYIGFEARGEGGFGFDPVFYVGEKSFAQLTAEEKDAVSHRGRALRLLAQKLPEYLKLEEGDK